jgi:hypothetical protein
MKNTDVVKDVSWGILRSASQDNSEKPSVCKRNKNSEAEVKRKNGEVKVNTVEENREVKENDRKLKGREMEEN